MKNVNINDTIRVQLTSPGEKILKDHYASYGQDVPDFVYDGDPKDGFVKMPLHEFCFIFGSELYMGSVAVIVNQNIEFI